MSGTRWTFFPCSKRSSPLGCPSAREMDMPAYDIASELEKLRMTSDPSKNSGYEWSATRRKGSSTSTWSDSTSFRGPLMTP